MPSEVFNTPHPTPLLSISELLGHSASVQSWRAVESAESCSHMREAVRSTAWGVSGKRSHLVSRLLGAQPVCTVSGIRSSKKGRVKIEY